MLALVITQPILRAELKDSWALLIQKPVKEVDNAAIKRQYQTIDAGCIRSMDKIICQIIGIATKVKDHPPMIIESELLLPKTRR